jgi:cellobiose dehydrogenase (acceptor)
MKSVFTFATLALAALATAQEYDYIVAGAGAAGLIVASRLAEAGKEVLLIERGRESTSSTGGQWAVGWNSSVTYYDVPGLANQIYSLYGNDPQGSPFCDDTADTAGCILGGGTEINMLAFVKPPSHDFERWPKAWQAPAMADAEARLYSRNPGTIWPSNDGRRYDQGVSDRITTN